MGRGFARIMAMCLVLVACQATLLSGSVTAAGNGAAIFSCVNGSSGDCSDIAIFGLGDSIASGHGLADDGSACQRSTSAYPYKLATSVQTELQRHATVTLLACSGATTLKPSDSTLSEDPDKWLSNQVDQANQQIAALPSNETVVVAISIGANDLDWTSRYPLIFGSDVTQLNATVSALSAQVSAALQPDLESLLAHPNVHVVVTSVPDPVNPTSVYFIASGGTCKPIGTIDCYARTVSTLTTLNNALQQTVQSVQNEASIGNRVSFTTGLFDQFQQHFSPAPGCGGTAVETTWIQQPSGTGSLIPSLNGNDCFHPNDAGAQALADAVLTSLYQADGFSTGDLTALQKVWSSTDSLVANQTVNRTWIWGPSANSYYVVEPYQHDTANGGQTDWRVVQYFDKSRMEITDPTVDATAQWYVTNGLLAEEIVTGRMQLGDNTFVQLSPAQVNVAGDLNDPNGPTYAGFNPLLGYGALPNGWTITQTVDRAGMVGDDASLASYNVTATDVGAPTSHTVASVFWDFMNSSGPVEQNGETTDGKLFPNPYYASGYPLTEAYWTHVLVGGVSKLVLVQVFERRVLTYTPDNPDGWKVEAGNVGLQYYQWRYGE
ncbi:MAG: SGNH/GDSL hydrolase family protein [Nitrolancea sp.]